MHTFTFRVEEIGHHLDGKKVIKLTEIHTRIGAKFHPDPLHRTASIQISTFGLDLNQYHLGQLVELKMSIVTAEMSIVTADEEPVRKKVANPDGLMLPFVSDSSLMRGPSIVDFVPMAVTDSDRAFVDIMRKPVSCDSDVSMMSPSSRRLAIKNFGRHKQYPATRMRIKRILLSLNECLETDEFCKVDLEWITTSLKIADVSTCSADVYDLRKWGILSWDGSDFKKSKVKFCIDWKSLLSPENQDDSRVPTEDDWPLHSDPVASNGMRDDPQLAH